MTTYPIIFDERADVDETAPFFIERNEERTAFRCCNRYKHILSHSPEQTPWFNLPVNTWEKLEALCNDKTGWYLQSNRIYIYAYSEYEIRGPKGYKIIPKIAKQLNLLSSYFPFEYRLVFFEYAIGKV